MMMMTTTREDDMMMMKMMRQAECSKNFATPPLSEVIGKSSNSSNETVIAAGNCQSSSKQTTATTTTSGKDPPEPMTMTTTEASSSSSSSAVAAAEAAANDNGCKIDTSILPDDCNITSSTEQNNGIPDEKRNSKLKNFLMLTAHLNPFHNNNNNNNNNNNHGKSQSKQSNINNLECSEDLEQSSLSDAATTTSAGKKPNTANRGRHRSYLGLIGLGHHLQRYFASYRGGHAANADFRIVNQGSEGEGDCNLMTTKSAPVTPIRWRPLEGDQAIRANGYNGTGKENTTESLNKIAGNASPIRPSVRFVDNGQNSLENSKLKVSSSSSKSIFEDDEKLSIEEEASNLVAKLFKLPLAMDGNLEAGKKLEELKGECPMDSDKFRQYGYSLIDYISNYLDTIDRRRVTPLNIEPGYLKTLIKPDAPMKGEPFANIMHDFENHIMCGITHWQHPHFHAYFPAGNAYPSILADMLSDALGCVGFSWAASPAYTELEIIMLDWMGKMIGLPDEFLCLSGGRSGSGQDSKGGGVIQGSASECVLVNLLAARHWAMEKLRKRYPNTQDGILLSKLIGYCSKEAHSCVEKAAMIGFIRMRALDTDENHSLRGETLAKAMAIDQANGMEPFIVCATLGTTSCVSFDNLEELGQVCQQHDVWLHVDAAYAGSALICPEFKYLMRGIELATSFNMNPNKWMLINFDCSLMWVKDRFKLTRAFVVDPLYLQHSFSDQAIDYRHWGIPLSRRFRALKLWFVIRNYGVEGLQAYIRNHVRLAKLFEQCIKQDSRFSVTNEVVLGLVCFRLIGSNALNQRLLSMINASGKLHMVPASLNGRYVIRFCVCDKDAKDEDILYAYKCISEFATELFESIKAGRERIRAVSQQNTIDVSNISLHRQQSASADRLNNMAHVDGGSGGSVEMDSANSKQLIQNGSGSGATGTAQQVAANGAAAAVSPREAARQYLMMRRNSRQIIPEHPVQPSPLTPLSARNSPSQAQNNNNGSLSGKSPLTKQASVQQTGAVDPQHTDEDLEQEIVLDSLASIDGYEYDLDDDDLLEPPLFGDDQTAAATTTNLNEPATTTTSGNQATNTDQQQPDESNGWRSPMARHWSSRAGRASRNQTLGGPASSSLAGDGGDGHEAEAEDEVFTLAERRQRMSLRYKREFFVRVVSDPRVYRASISGLTDTHSSSCSLSGSQQQQNSKSQTKTSTVAATTTTTTTAITTSASSAIQSGGTSTNEQPASSEQQTESIGNNAYKTVTSPVNRSE